MSQQTHHSKSLLKLRETFLPLLFALVCFLIISPLAAEIPLMTSLLVSALLLSGLLVVVRSRASLVIVISGLIITLSLRWVLHFVGEENMFLALLTYLTMAAYLALLCALVVIRVLAHQQITRDTVIGSMCGYLLIAYMFGALYAALVRLSPGALSMGGAGSGVGNVSGFSQNSWILAYFSFVTLTTLGYGDILPVSSLARSLVMLEVLIGQLYLAAFVARLVGAIGVTRHASEHENIPSKSPQNDP